MNSLSGALLIGTLFVRSIISLIGAFEIESEGEMVLAGCSAGPILDLINETTAAAIYCGAYKNMENGERKTIVVIDLGGGKLISQSCGTVV